MDRPYKPPCILRLTGVRISDYVPVEDIADERLLELEPTSETDVCTYDAIPPTFTTIDRWPATTNLRCWQCDERFDTPPCFVPTHVREVTRPGAPDSQIEFGVHGNMCSFVCAELWISTQYAGDAERQWRARDNLAIVYFMFTGRRTACIRPAPNKTEMREYGGVLSADEFRAKKVRAEADIARAFVGQAAGNDGRADQIRPLALLACPANIHRR